MAHQIERNYAFFSNSKPAWHGLGTVLKGTPSAQEAWKLAYPWEVFKLPVDARLEDGDQVHHTECFEHSAIVRSDGKVLSVMGKGYEVIQPHSVFSAFEPMIDSGLVELEAGGSLCEGKKLWVLGKIKDSDQTVLPNDVVKAYILFATSFDGSIKLSAGMTGVRVVCANTLAQANRAGIEFKVKHTASAKMKFDSYVDELEKMLHSFRQSVESYKHLANRKVSRTAQEEYITKLIEPDLLVPAKVDNVSTKAKNKVYQVIDLLDSQRGISEVPAMKGTAWQAYNAVSEFITHDMGRNQDSRLNGQYFGDGARLNDQALNLALAM